MVYLVVSIIKQATDAVFKRNNGTMVVVGDDAQASWATTANERVVDEAVPQSNNLRTNTQVQTRAPATRRRQHTIGTKTKDAACKQTTVERNVN